MAIKCKINCLLNFSENIIFNEDIINYFIVLIKIN